MLEGLLAKAIKSFLDSKTSSTLRTLIGTKYYFNTAPSNVTGVYLVFSIMGVSPDYYQGDLSIEELQVQFNLFKEDMSAAAVLEAGAALCDLFDDATEISISGYSSLLFERRSSVCIPPQTGENIPDQQYTVLYHAKFYK